MALKTTKKICVPVGEWKEQVDALMHKGQSKVARPLHECPDYVRVKYYVAISYMLRRVWTTYPSKSLKFVTQQTQLVRISNKRWKLEIGTEWDEIRANLLKAGILECDDSYCPHGECAAGKPYPKGYRFSPLWCDAEFEIAEIKYTEPRQPKRKKKLNNFEKEERKLRESIQRQLNKVSLDKDKARLIYDIAKQAKRWNPNQMLVHELVIDYFSSELKTIAITGRIFTDANMMIAEMREALLIGGMRTAEVDITASQPTLLASLYPIDSEEREEYLELIDSGQFYETIAQYVGETRKETKSLVYRYIFGGKSERVAEWFALHFPELEKIIAEMPENSLVHDLQRKESNVIVHDLMLDSGIDCVSIHDGLRCPIADAEKCRKLIVQSFERRYGITPQVTIDYPDDEQEQAA